MFSVMSIVCSDRLVCFGLLEEFLSSHLIFVLVSTICWCNLKHFYAFDICVVCSNFLNASFDWKRKLVTSSFASLYLTIMHSIF